jgi:hypothetical protein
MRIHAGWSHSVAALALMLVASAAAAKDTPISVDVMKPAEFSIPGVRKIAVTPFKGPNGQAVCNSLTAKIFEGKAFSIMERAEIDRIMKEHNLGMEGIVDEATAAQVGKMAGVDALVFGQVDDYGVTDEASTTPLKKKRLLGKNAEGQNVWEPYEVNCPTTVRNGRLSVTFKVVKIESGEIVAIKNGSASFAGKQIKNPNADPFDYCLFCENPYDKSKGELPTSSAVEVSLLNDVSGQFMRSISPYKARVTLVWDDDIGKEGDAVVKLLFAGMNKEANDMLQSTTGAITTDPKAKPKKIMAAHYDSGILQEIMGDYEKALESYKKAVATDPAKATTNQMGAVARIQGMIEDQKKLQEQQQR